MIIDVKCAFVFLELSEIQFKMSVIQFDFRVVFIIKCLDNFDTHICVQGIPHQDNMSVCFIPPYIQLFIVKLGFSGVYIIFLFMLENICCGYSLEPPQ